MKKLLMAEVAVLLVLVVAAIGVRLSLTGREPQSATVHSTQGPTQTQAAVTQAPTPEPSREAFAPQSLALTAQQYFVYDCQAEQFLILSQEENERIYPASITKLFTAYVALQYLEPEDVITAGDALEMVAPGSSTAKIQWGDRLTVKMLVEAMLLPSGNDAAYILAVNIGRTLENNRRLHYSDAAIAFVEEMNRQAQELGLSDTHFANPDGIHKDSHYSSPRDLVKMARLSLEDPTIAKYAALRKDVATFASGGEHKWENTNALLDPESEFYSPYAKGLKTGQTPRAGSCLLSAFEYQGRSLILGVFGCPEVDDRFVDTLKLFHHVVGLPYAYVPQDKK